MSSEFLKIIEGVIFLLVASVLLYAAISDARKFIIPNNVSIILGALFCIAWLLVPTESAVFSHVGAGLAVLLVGMVLFRFNLFGAGDVKLWAAAALWFGFGSIHVQLVYVGFLGAALGTCLYLARLFTDRHQRPNDGAAVSPAPRILQVGAGVPYGIAIAAGTLLTLDRSPLFLHLFG